MKSQIAGRESKSIGSVLGLSTLACVLRLCVLLIIGLGFVRPSAGASVSLTSLTMASPRLVGDLVDLTPRLSLADQEGPGTFDIMLRWGTEREATPYWIGALVLQRLPSLPAPTAFLSVVMGDDCAAGIGSTRGSCTLSATVHQAASAVSRRLASFEFAYQWIPEPGFEICPVPGFDGCVEAGQAAGVLGALVGDGNGASLSTTTLGLQGVRPIPEPTAATLTAIGLGLLASRKRRPPCH